ncbi:MAG: hypothetical protein MPJ22_00545 [Pirellulales bacterium]|nr:hypothetical protein [Pirellulales bacterium]
MAPPIFRETVKALFFVKGWINGADFLCVTDEGWRLSAIFTGVTPPPPAHPLPQHYTRPPLIRVIFAITRHHAKLGAGQTVIVSVS